MQESKTAHETCSNPVGLQPSTVINDSRGDTPTSRKLIIATARPQQPSLMPYIFDYSECKYCVEVSRSGVVQQENSISGDPKVYDFVNIVVLSIIRDRSEREDPYRDVCLVTTDKKGNNNPLSASRVRRLFVKDTQRTCHRFNGEDIRCWLQPDI